MNITFNADGPKKMNVSAVIVNDEVALEADEIVTVRITDVSPIPGVNVGLQTTVVTIIDDDRKLQIVRPEFFPGVCQNVHLLYYLCSIECFSQQIRTHS